MCRRDGWLFVPEPDVIAVVAFVSLAGVGVGGMSTLIRAMPIEMSGVGPEFTGTAVGLMFAFGEVGGFVGPFLIGVLKDATGTYDAGIAVLIAASLLAVAAAFLIDDVSVEGGERGV